MKNATNIILYKIKNLSWFLIIVYINCAFCVYTIIMSITIVSMIDNIFL